MNKRRPRAIHNAGQHVISILRTATCAVAALLVAGCAIGDQIAEDGIEYNKSVEKFTNGQILLNILRAKERERMIFTAFSQIRGRYSFTTSGNLSLLVPFGGDAASVFNLTPAITVSRTVNPSFDVAILDSEEFMNGILQPIPTKILEYYWQQRWPQDVLLYMFIQKVEHTITGKDADGKTVNKSKTYSNNPVLIDENRWRIECPPERLFAGFAHWVNCMQEEGILVRNVNSGRSIGGPLTASKASDLKELINAEKAGLRLVPSGAPTTHYQLCKVTAAPAFCLRECPKANLAKLCAGSEQAAEQPGRKEFAQQKKGLKNRYVVHLRSVQSMLYYLGEIIREADEREADEREADEREADEREADEREADKSDTQPVRIRFGLKEERPKNILPLFALKKGSPTGAEKTLSVEYRGETYFVSNDRKEGGASKTVTTLISQLLGLQKKSKELPTTTAVEVVGQN